MEELNLRHAANMFRHLNGGNFICSNSCRDEERIWYDILEENWEEYRDAWRKTTGLVLSRGDQYFYFRRSFDGDNSSLKKLDEFYKKAVKIVNLIHYIDQSFDVGNNVSLTWLLSGLDGSTEAQKLCRDLTMKTERMEQAQELIKMLSASSNTKGLGILGYYFDPEKNEDRYVVQSAYRYYLSFIERILALNPEEEENIVEAKPMPGLFDEYETPRDMTD